MARRAAFIQSLRKNAPTKDKTLVVALPDEFVSADSPRPGDANTMAAMAKAFNRMAYDAGTLTRAEAEVLAASGAPVPPGFAVAGPEPATTIVTVAGVPVGLVRFPDAPASREPMPPALAEATAKAAAALRGKVGLVIGLSGWGTRPEEAFLAAHPGAVDILLGSGPGSGRAGRIAGNGHTLWARTYYLGKTVNRIDLFAWPTGPEHIWKPDAEFRTDVISLDDRYPADPTVAKLF